MAHSSEGAQAAEPPFEGTGHKAGLYVIHVPHQPHRHTGETMVKTVRYVKGNSGKPIMYPVGRATVADSAELADLEQPPPIDPPLTVSDACFQCWRLTDYLANDWSRTTDQRLDAIAADTFDLADRVNQSLIIVVAAFLIIAVGLAAMLIMMLQ